MDQCPWVGVCGRHAANIFWTGSPTCTWSVCCCVPPSGNAHHHSSQFRPKLSKKAEVSHLFPINWFHFFRYDTRNAKSQVHCSGVMQWWACSSLMSAPLLAEAGCETCERIVRKTNAMRLYKIRVTCLENFQIVLLCKLSEYTWLLLPTKRIWVTVVAMCGVFII